MKKRILSILLTLCMVLMLVPVTAFAETPGSIAITVDGFVAGKTPADCTVTIESTIPGVTFSEGNIQYSYWDKYAADGDGYQIANDDAFQAGTRYKYFIDLDINGLTEVPVVTVNGNTPDYCTFRYSDGVPEKLSIGCDLGTPAPYIIINGPDVVCAEQPTDPMNPDTDSKPESTNPQTGADSHMALCFALLFVSGAGVIGTTVCGKKKRAK